MYQRHAVDIHAYWKDSDQSFPRIYRAMEQIEWQPLKRDNVKAGSNSSTGGCCLGVSRGAKEVKPYIYMPARYQKFAHMIMAPAKEAYPTFTYTSMQISLGLAAGLHTDGANLGPSIVVALGPHTGGQLWIHRAVQGQIIEVQR